MKKMIALSFGFLFLAAGCEKCQICQLDSKYPPADETGFVAKSIQFDDTAYKYTVFVPENYTPKKAWPAILFLHGMGERGTDNNKQTYQGIGKYIRVYPERYPCIVIMPQCPEKWVWNQKGAELALLTLDQTEKEYRIDKDRIILTGLSMGGFGTWLIGAEHTERFSALAPVCGGGDPANAEKLAMKPIWCFHGTSDKAVPVERSQEMVKAVKAAEGNIRYSEFPWIGHASWDPAYGDAEFTAWMLAQRR